LAAGSLRSRFDQAAGTIATFDEVDLMAKSESGHLAGRRYCGAVAVIAAICIAAVVVPAFADTPGVSDPGQVVVRPAAAGVLDLFANHPIVALGDAHGLAQEEALYSKIVEDPRFAADVQNVVVEFGDASEQRTIDRYVNGDDVSFDQLRRIWTDTAGAFDPGESIPVGLENFFATVRAVNLKLPLNRRIKVWLGDPSVDWSRIHSFQDLMPFVRQRDAFFFSVLDQLLVERKKALVIIGLGHLFGPPALNALNARMDQKYPGRMAVVAPFLGYIEDRCNRRFVSDARGWPVPSLIGPVLGTNLEQRLQMRGCSYMPASQIAMMKNMKGPPPGAHTLSGAAPPSPQEMLAANLDILSGRRASAILYLGAPTTLTESPIDPSTYLNLEYFKEAEARARCCSRNHSALVWEELVREGSVVPQRFQVPR
jgi:hypothetical protein